MVLLGIKHGAGVVLPSSCVLCFPALISIVLFSSSFILNMFSVDLFCVDLFSVDMLFSLGFFFLVVFFSFCPAKIVNLALLQSWRVLGMMVVRQRMRCG